MNKKYSELLLIFLSSKFPLKLRLLMMVLLLSITPLVSFGQCAYPSTAKSVGTYTFCIDNSNSITTATVKAGEYVLVDVIKGFGYTFSVENVWDGWFWSEIDENLTLFDASNNTNVGFKSGESGASVNWIATFSGQIKILLSKGNCKNDGSPGGKIKLTLNSIGNTLDNQNEFGIDKWVGHIYNSSGASPEPFYTASYVGSYNVNAETINENFGGSTACFPVYSNEIQRASIYTEGFAVRYRMKSTKTGYYFLNVNGDDGIRVYVDGVLVFNQWKEQSNATYCNNLIYLNGNSDIILDYYENGVDNIVGFSLAAFVPSNNTIAGKSEINVCSGVSPKLLDGSSYSGCGGIINTTFQWQVSTDNVNFTNISGATSEDYTPPTITTTTVDVKYYRRVLKASGFVITGLNPATNSVKVTISSSVPATPGTITGSTTQCANTLQTYSIAAVANAVSYNWTLPANWTTTAGAGTNSITVSIASNGASGNVSVNAVNGCGSSGSISQWVNLNPQAPSVAPVAKAASNIQCSYAQLNFSTGPNVTGIYLDIAKDSGFTDFLPGYNGYVVAYNNGSIPVSNLLAGTLYYRIRGYNSCGITANSNAISFSTPSPIGGDVSPAQSICSATSPANLTLSGYSTTNTEILKWQKSSDAAFSNPIDIIGTTPTLLGATIGNLMVNTYFRAVVRNKFGSWCESFSNAVLISIAAKPVITPNKVDETCPVSNDGSISPTLSGGLTNIRYIKLTQKYVNADAWQQVAEIQAFEIFTAKNVALASNGATVTSSSDYLNDTANNGPQKTIDGDVNSIWHSNSPNVGEYITVDLSSSKNLDNIVIYNRKDCCGERGRNMLLELFDASNNLLYSKTIDLYQSGANVPVNINVLDVSWADNASTLNRTGLDSGTYTLNYADAMGCPVSTPIAIGVVNPAPNTPVVKSTTHPDCQIKTASVEFTGLPTGSWTITTNPTTANLLGTTGNSETTIVSGLSPNTNYTFTVSNGSCSSSPSVSVFIKALPLVATYNNGWTNGPPTIEQSIVFDSNYSSLGNIVGCDCKVNPGKNVTINSGHTLTLTNELNTVGASLTIENTGSLVQINDAALNYGKIKYVRVTNTGVRNTDFTYWSSPVAQSKLGGTGGMEYQPANLEGTYFDSFYVDAVNQYWQSESMSNEMIPTRGYSIRGPGPINANPLSFLQVTFEGTPNNGAYSIPNVFEGKSYLVGNPYPSALDADQFLIDNRDVLDGTLYFWTHKTQVGIGVSKPGSGLYAYSGDDYATYNLTGGTATAKAAPSDPDQSLNNPFIPNGKIAAGQGFFANTKLSPESNIIKFTNSMRVGVKGNTGTNTQFFKTATTKSKKTTYIEKNRLWLNLYSDEGAFKQLLVGYITGATNEYDNGYDGETFDGNELADFYSINQETNFAIQGRALPFEASDVVPLGYRSKDKVTMSIDIDQVDGAIESQNIFIEDKMLNVVHDLKKGAYTFTTEAGVFNDRFVLRYTNKILGNVDFDLLNEQVIISKDKKELKIKSEIEKIKRVTVFDLLGKKVLDKELLNETEFRSSTIGLSKQVGIVKVTLSSDKVITKKIAF